MTKIVNGYSLPLNPAPARRLNLRYLNGALFASLGVLGAFYLVNISHLTVQGFVLRDLKSRASELASVNTEQEEAVNLAQSYNALEARTPELKMVAIGDVEYLAADNLAVAKR